ncbi:GntR family transcriptional regulator [Croceicoccus marinus]|uniref:GntR family transcriptional regulator n=2 Tax=Croceicoccus marinus TaxID=450378 RepID=A0A7G6VZW0_9SPHN|nr:GntR family transcriptional regulator [Croceicoccus marinus]QNE07275.1 GntR family transcriptional regulator [Croceicoccus marinus]
MPVVADGGADGPEAVPNWSFLMAEREKQKQTLADQLYEILRQRIVSLNMPPRMRFTEREISQETGFGAMPVREALDRLNHDGLVETIPRRGYRVAGLTLKSVDDFFTVWSVVSPLIIQLARERATPKQIESLNTIHQEHLRAVRKARLDPEHWIRMSRQRFDLLAEATRNPQLQAIYRKLSAEMDRIFHSISHHREDIRAIFELGTRFDTAIPSVDDASEFIKISREKIAEVIIEKGFDYSQGS